MSRSSRLVLVLTAFVAIAGPPLAAQQAPPTPRALTADDYARAERFMGYNTNPLVFRMTVRPNWLTGRSLLVSGHGAGRRRVRPGRSGPREHASRPSITPGWPRHFLGRRASRYTALTLPFNELRPHG